LTREPKASIAGAGLARRRQRGYTSPKLNLPDLLSLVRLPLGVAFVPLAGSPIAALAVLALAAVSDVFDGWLARRQPQPLIWEPSEGSHTLPRWSAASKARRLPTRIGWGEWLDPVCDKFFIIAVMAGIYLSQHPPLTTLLPIVTREAAILLLFLIYRLVPSLRSIRYDYRAHALGKAATAAQFLAATALLLAHPAAKYLAALCALLGVLCAGVYAKRGRAMVQGPGTSGCG
jgi:phosphatidylglycerophosphate synthase